MRAEDNHRMIKMVLGIYFKVLLRERERVYVSEKFRMT